MNKEPEITIQYFIDRGRRRTLTLSLKRLNTIFGLSLAFVLWSFAVTGFLIYHAFNGGFSGSESQGPVKGVVVNSASPDTSEKKVSLSAKSAPLPEKMVAVAAVATQKPTPTEASHSVPAKEPELAQYSIENLLAFENNLKKTQAVEPLRFANVKLHLQENHLRVESDIEKLQGDSVEGHAFVAVEFVLPNGVSRFVTSHGMSSWDDAISKSSLKAATYYKARIRSHKRFDVIFGSVSGVSIKAIKLVAFDERSNQLIVEEITPDHQSDVLGF